MVGFQTNLKYADQERVFRLIPGLENAEFVRLGQMHRNTFINAPLLLDSTMKMRSEADLFIAGQLAGVEGYMGNVASGWLAGTNAARLCKGMSLLRFPVETMTGALINYLSHSEAGQFQPMKANFGILPRLNSPPRGKRDRYAAMSTRALETLDKFLASSSKERGPEI
jgi:methylenetetrahydrofolate--tRNA-(uracil-5-)-methyltransferase